MGIENVNINAYHGMATQLLKRSERIDAFQERHPDKGSKFEAALETIKENFTTIIQIKYDTDVQAIVNGFSTKEIDEINEQIDAVREQIDETEAQIAQIKGQLDPEDYDLEPQIAELEGVLASLHSQLNQLQGDLQLAKDLFDQQLNLFDALTDTEKQLLRQLYPDGEYPV